VLDDLASGDTQARKAYLRSVISYIEVGDDRIRIVGETAALAAVAAGQQNHSNNVRGFVRKWRARKDSNL
jgi:site-specific DNA recombinase